MNEQAQRVLEYDKIKDIIAGFALSAPGAQAARAMQPAAGEDAVHALLEETAEYLALIGRGDVPPLDGIKDLGPLLEKLSAAGGMLAPAELLDVASTLGTGRRVQSFFQRSSGDPASGRTAPRLGSRAAALQPRKQIEDAVFAAIDDSGEVKDSASPALRKIRKQLARVREDILARLTRILQSSATQHVVQEQVITVRDGRYVLPLKQNFRQGVKGVVHGQSGSRATVFVEPLDVLDQNNRLTELRSEEQEEVEAVLRGLTALVVQDAPAVSATFHILTALDAIQARARFGVEYGGSIPSLSGPGGPLRLRAARHPLLMGRRGQTGKAAAVTPNDIALGGPDRLLIISGPNAGGKTVVLKTLGLLSLMAQSGIPVTAAEGSDLPLFSDVFADIGDEQSLERDLSTFSSHIVRVAEILRSAGTDALVLFDELGAGTDPAEGAALGAAVLDSLLARRCMTVVTTHHSALKLFGAQTGGAVNAAMEFDPATLKPTYRMIAGRPGRSYGLDMAARFGIPGEVVEGARSRLTKDALRLEDLLEDLEREARDLADSKESAEQAREAAKRDRDAAGQERATAQKASAEILARARDEARTILSSLRQKLRDLSRSAAMEPAKIQQVRGDVEHLARQLQSAEPERSDAAGLQVQPGEQVAIPKFKAFGTVLARFRGSVEVDVAGKTFRLSAQDVLPAAAPKAGAGSGRTPGWSVDLPDDEAAPDRVNIIGFHVPEGLAEVEHLLNRAALQGLSSVVVIHGHGSGALRTAVNDLLNGHPLVAACRPGGRSEGGAGVTVAELKK